MPVAAKAPFAPRTLKVIQDLSGGLNNKVSPFLIADNELSAVSNMHYDEQGTLQKRKGTVARYAAVFGTGKVQGLYGYYRENGNAFLVMGCDGKLFRDSAQFRRIWDIEAEWEEDGATTVGVSTTVSPGYLSLPTATTTPGGALLGLINLGTLTAMLGGNARSGQWLSTPIEISAIVDGTSGRLVVVSTTPAGTSIAYETRTSADQVTWGVWSTVVGGVIASAWNNYVQVRVTLTSNSSVTTPTLDSMTLTYDVVAAPTQIFTGGNITARWSFITQNDILYALNGVDSPQKWTGAGNTVIQPGTPPVGKYTLVSRSRQFIAGTAANRSRIYYSSVGDPETWPALNFIDVGKGEGDFITGLAFFLDVVVISKNRSLWVLQGDSSSNFVLRKVSEEPSCVDGHGFGIYKNTLFMPAYDGIRTFDGVRNLIGSIKIEGTYAGLNNAQLGQASGVWFKNKYYCSVPNGTILHNNKIIVFDTIHNSWTIYDDLSVSEMAIWVEYNVPKLIFGSSVKGQLYNTETGYNDDNVAISCTATTKHYDFGGPDRIKLARTCFVNCREPSFSPTTMTVQFVKDLGAASTPLTLTIPANANINVLRAIPSAVSVSIVRTIGIKISHSALNLGLNVYGIVLDYVVKGERQTS